MFPERALINLTMPKTKLFSSLQADAAFKRAYEESVEKFTWMYSLDPERINTPATKEVSKIDVQFLSLKKYSPAVIQSLIIKIESKMPKGSARRIYFCEFDGVWSLHIVYRSTGCDAREYYLSGEVSPESLEIPASYNLSMLYEYFVKLLVLISPRDGENFDELVERNALVKKMTKEAAVLEKKMRAENQPKQKIEMNIELQKLQSKINELRR